jgi:hypothetical protein
MRAPGMILHKMPLFVWAMLFQSIIILMALPVLAGKIVPALNLAVCWEPLKLEVLVHSVKIFVDVTMGNQQVTYEDLNLLGNLNDCAPELSIYINNISYNSIICFGSYLAGLIEGDGRIVVPKEERSPKGKLNYPSIQICFQLSDFPLCIYLQKLIGHGSIQKKKHRARYVLYINNLAGIIHVVNLINGKIRGSKNSQLILLIEFLNKKKLFNIKPLGLDKTSLEKNNWLTGFIEADGCFSVNVNKTSKGKNPRISVKFELVQIQITHYGFDTFPLLKLVADMLEVNVKPLRLHTKFPQYRITTSSYKTNANLINYLEKFPLKGTKYLNYKD